MDYFQWTLSCTLSCPLSSGLGSGMSSHVYPPQEQLKIRMVNITNSKLRPLREQTSKLFLWPTQTTLRKHSLLGFNWEIIQRAVFRVFCTAFQYSSLNVWSNFLNLLQYSKLGGGLIWPLPFLGEHEKLWLKSMFSTINSVLITNNTKWLYFFLFY